MTVDVEATVLRVLVGHALGRLSIVVKIESAAEAVPGGLCDCRWRSGRTRRRRRRSRRRRRRRRRRRQRRRGRHNARVRGCETLLGDAPVGCQLNRHGTHSREGRGRCRCASVAPQLRAGVDGGAVEHVDVVEVALDIEGGKVQLHRVSARAAEPPLAVGVVIVRVAERLSRAELHNA